MFSKKIKPFDEETDAKAVLRKILTTMDTCRATGLPEASANLLLYPHRYTSSKIFRLDTRSYLPPGELPDKLTLNVLNPLLHEATKENDEFEIPSAEYSLNLSKQSTLDSITKNYFDRPQWLYNNQEMKMISSKQTSMTEYTENYKITRKRKLTNEEQSVDKRNRIVEPRDKSDQDVILDLKFRT